MDQPPSPRRNPSRSTGSFSLTCNSTPSFFVDMVLDEKDSARSTESELAGRKRVVRTGDPYYEAAVKRRSGGTALDEFLHKRMLSTMPSNVNTRNNANTNAGVGQYAPAHYNQPKENVVKSSGHENTQLYIDGCGNSEVSKPRRRGPGVNKIINSQESVIDLNKAPKAAKKPRTRGLGIEKLLAQRFGNEDGNKTGTQATAMDDDINTPCTQGATHKSPTTAG
ncbi:hypothetical protein DCAR_0311566 [Daucus carota subsp. sativus]|uniref:Uncharacterized protein n=1 Tax=Daucus carota subsp. sativus TaxID=79200 RepID=A0A161ZUP6_DAUCS|nr:hypothetical protein DCAR_0311566 [Daucus carota subsp. sativus]